MWVWTSMTPGITHSPERSTTSAPSGIATLGPTSMILFSFTRMIASFATTPVAGSIRFPARIASVCAAAGAARERARARLGNDPRMFVLLPRGERGLFARKRRESSTRSRPPFGPRGALAPEGREQLRADPPEASVREEDHVVSLPQGTLEGRDDVVDPGEEERPPAKLPDRLDQGELAQALPLGDLLGPERARHHHEVGEDERPGEGILEDPGAGGVAPRLEDRDDALSL